MSTSEDRTLDGNAAAGMLSELFALDVTAAEIVCAGCGVTAEIGAARAYGGAMGAILRCAQCDGVLLRLTHTRAGLWIDMRGARRMFVAAPRRVAGHGDASCSPKRSTARSGQDGTRIVALRHRRAAMGVRRPS